MAAASRAALALSIRSSQRQIGGANPDLPTDTAAMLEQHRTRKTASAAKFPEQRKGRPKGAPRPGALAADRLLARAKREGPLGFVRCANLTGRGTRYAEGK